MTKISKTESVSLQINLTPRDLPHASLILPHQLRLWAAQCQDLLLIWDCDPGPRYQELNYRKAWDLCLQALPEFQAALESDWPQLRQLYLPLESQKKSELAQALSLQFFGPNAPPLPSKDYRGGPFLAYFLGFAEAKFDWLLHLDADMMFSGQNNLWLNKACQLLIDHPELACISPPGGPAHPNTQRNVRSDFFSTRSFLINRKKLYHALSLSYRLEEAQENQNWVTPYAELVEIILNQWMKKESLWRADFSDCESEIWSLHPPVPLLPEFLTYLPQLLIHLELGTLPKVQTGHYNLQADTLEAIARMINI
jgi:hypothetical protein